MSWRRRIALALTAGALALGCATTVQTPVEEISPRTRAHRVYKMLLAREGRSPDRDPRTLAGFPEAPVEVAEQLEALATSSRDPERKALLKLAEALRRTGNYSRVLFRTQPQNLTVKYKPIALKEPKTAHAGWNSLPIGIYHVWGEQKGEIVSPIDEYDIIDKQLLILVKGPRE